MSKYDKNVPQDNSPTLGEYKLLEEVRAAKAAGKTGIFLDLGEYDKRIRSRSPYGS